MIFDAISGSPLKLRQISSKNDCRAHTRRSAESVSRRVQARAASEGVFHGTVAIFEVRLSFVAPFLPWLTAPRAIGYFFRKLDMKSSPAEQLFQMITGFALSQSISVAARLGIADLLKDGPKGSDELAKSAGVDESSRAPAAVFGRPGCFRRV